MEREWNDKDALRIARGQQNAGQLAHSCSEEPAELRNKWPLVACLCVRGCLKNELVFRLWAALKVVKLVAFSAVICMFFSKVCNFMFFYIPWIDKFSSWWLILIWCLTRLYYLLFSFEFEFFPLFFLTGLMKVGHGWKNSNIKYVHEPISFSHFWGEVGDSCDDLLSQFLSTQSWWNIKLNVNSRMLPNEVLTVCSDLWPGHAAASWSSDVCFC